MNRLPYTPKHEKEWIEKTLSKRYFKKPYDRFMWWRSYTPKNKPLTNRHPLRDRIANGDFEQGPFLLEAELTLHRMNEKFIECIGKDGTPDHGKFHSDTTMERVRRKRLLEDFEKDEAKKLSELKTAFTSYRWKLTKDQYEEEIANFDGTTLKFYDYIEKKYS